MTNWQRYAIGEAIDAGSTWERRSPARRPAVSSDVGVPLAQTVVSGVVLALGVGVGAALCGASWRSFVYAGVGFVAGVVLCWFALLSGTRQLLWTVERVTRTDLDGDRHVGAPPAARPPVQVEVTQTRDDGRLAKMIFANLDISDEQLEQLARGLLDGKSTVATWTGSGGAFSRGEFERARDELIRAGLLYWVNESAHAQGVGLTAVGRRFCHRVLADSRVRTRAHAIERDTREALGL